MDRKIIPVDAIHPSDLPRNIIIPKSMTLEGGKFWLWFGNPRRPPLSETLTSGAKLPIIDPRYPRLVTSVRIDI